MRSLVIGICLLPLTLLSGETDVYIGVQHFYTTLKSAHRPDLKGYEYGVTAGCTYYQNCYFTDLSIEADWNPNQLHGDHWYKSKVREQIARLKLGYIFHFDDCITLKPFLGFGYNWLHLQDGITYKYRKAFIPIGFTAWWNVARCFKVGAQLEYRPDVRARLTTLSKKLTIRRREAYRLELPFLFDLCGSTCMTLSVIPTFDVNRFGPFSKENSQGVPFPISTVTRRDYGLRVLLNNTF